MLSLCFEPFCQQTKIMAKFKHEIAKITKRKYSMFVYIFRPKINHLPLKLLKH